MENRNGHGMSTLGRVWFGSAGGAKQGIVRPGWYWQAGWRKASQRMSTSGAARWGRHVNDRRDAAR